MNRVDRTVELVALVEDLADRYRRMPQSRLNLRFRATGRRFPPAGRTRAQAARELADRIVAATGEGAGPLPEEGEFVVGDQLAVAVHDLAAAGGGGVEVVRELLADAKELKKHC
jgi:hypothetical protein